MVRSPSNTAVEVVLWESLVIELLMTVFAYQHTFNWDNLDAGRSGLQRIKKGMSPELKRELGKLDRTSPHDHTWSTLAGWTWLKGLREPEPAATALEAEPDGAELLWPAPTRRRLALVIRLWHRDLLAAQADEVREQLRREVEAKRELATSLAPEQLIETATNGIVWRPRQGVRKVVLVPTQAMSPWSTHEHVGNAVLFTFPVAKAVEPLERVQQLAWVLADRSRLAALRLLAARSLTLQELADELGVSKSTMHHHLAQLRAAGLLRVPYGTKNYSLRREPLRELGGALKDFGRES
jgi:DNA-binding transcriptional ArsR family regulator